MLIHQQDFDYLVYLAEEIEAGDDFEKNAREFRELAESVKDQIYRNCDDPNILDMVDRLPTIEFQPYRRSLLEQLLPRAQRNMVGNYKVREKIRTVVRENLSGLERIQRLSTD